MLSEVGYILVGLAMAVAIYTPIATFRSIRRSDGRWAESGRNGAYVTAGLLGMAVLLLLAAFLGDQFQIRYVAQHSSRDLPLYLKVSDIIVHEIAGNALGIIQVQPGYYFIEIQHSFGLVNQGDIVN